MARSPRAFKQALPEILARCEGELTAFCQTLITELLEQFHALEARLGRAEQWIKDVMKRSPLCRKIAAVEGIGPVTATAIVAAVGEAKEFKNGRHLAAWLGLVPRQYSSGGRSQLKGISKRGDTYLRTLLIHGARTVLRYVAAKTDARSLWLQQLIARRGYNRAAVALTNKNARVVQVLLSSQACYRSATAAA